MIQVVQQTGGYTAQTYTTVCYKRTSVYYALYKYTVHRVHKHRGMNCSVSRWRPQKVDKRMVLEYTHGLFIT